MHVDENTEPDKLWVVDSGFAVGGLIIRRHKCLDCAPIFRKWFLGRMTGDIRQMCRNKNWKLTEVD